MNLTSFADWIRSSTSTVEPSQAPAKAAPGMRESPDGSLIHNDWSFDWTGKQGDPDALVTLTKRDGTRVLLEGVPFSQLQHQGVYDDETSEWVWIPASTREVPQRMAPATQHAVMAGLGEVRRRRVVVGGVTLVGLLAGGYGLWWWWKNRSEK